MFTGKCGIRTIVVASSLVVTVAVSLSVPPLLHAQDVSAVQQGAGATPLRPGAPVERQIAGGGVDHYVVQLSKGEVLDATAEQNGIDVVVTVIGADGRQIDLVDSPNGTKGPEPIWLVAQTAGTYRIDVRPLEAGAIAGKYTLTMKPTRMASAAEQQLLGREQQLVRALGQQDVTTLGTLLEPNATWITPVGGHLDGRELLEARRTPDPKYEIQQTRLRLQQFGDVAVVSGHETVADSARGTSAEREFARTWMRQNGTWKLISAQFTGATEPARSVSIDPSTIDRYVGEYRAAPGQAASADTTPLNLARNGDRLVLRDKTGDLALEPEASNVFYSSNMRGRLIFTPVPNGQGMQVLFVPYTSSGRLTILQRGP